jgi:hypothetical protein
MIDTNVYLSRWPFRRLAGDETPELVAMLRRQGVTEAWAGSFDGVLHKDVAGVNARLAAECARSGGLLVPFGTVNPKLPDWEEDLRRCAEVHRMAGIRLHPNYHGYGLDDPDFAMLLRRAGGRGLLVQVALKMEDERTQHPLVRVATVDAAPLAKLVPGIPGARVMVLNGLRDLAGKPLRDLLEAGVSFDIGMLERVGGLGRLVGEVGATRLLFGSYSPFFVFESALLKLRESAFDPEASRAILEGNAARLLPAGR